MSKNVNLKQRIIGKIAEFMVKGTSEPPSIARAYKPPADSKVGFITTAGVHKKSDKPFNTKGDHTFRIIPGDISFSELTITHDHYDKEEALKDINCVFPLEILRGLKDEGYIGEVAPRNFGLMGYIPEVKYLIEETAPAIADMLEEDGVDIALFSPG